MLIYSTRQNVRVGEGYAGCEWLPTKLLFQTGRLPGVFSRRSSRERSSANSAEATWLPSGSEDCASCSSFALRMEFFEFVRPTRLVASAIACAVRQDFPALVAARPEVAHAAGSAPAGPDKAGIAVAILPESGCVRETGWAYRYRLGASLRKTLSQFPAIVAAPDRVPGDGVCNSCSSSRTETSKLA
jgi:hypothetical protein